MKISALFCSLLLSLSAYAAEPIRTSDHLMLYKTEGAFSDVNENLRLAIEEQGLVITFTAHVGEMLERTGKDLGLENQVYLAANVHEFCSAGLTHKMVTANTENLVFCPYSVHLYELTAEPGTIYVGYKRPRISGSEDAIASLLAIDDLLNTIVNDALEW
jgi:uncharacterized protein (DUF302 family)